MKLVCYIRGGLGDIWPAFSAIFPIMQQYNINRNDVIILTDSVYYFRRHHHPKIAEFSLRMLEKITPNIIMIPWQVNDNFYLEIDDITDELSQENADKMKKEFMFWRPDTLKNFVAGFLGPGTIFIDALFTECIMEWDFVKGEYRRVGNLRAECKFEPPKIERSYIDQILTTYNRHVLVHVRKKEEGDAVTQTDEYYTKILTYCKEKKIMPILIGSDSVEIKKGIPFVDLRGVDALSFEAMAYLINGCKVMLGNDSGFSAIKLYQQQQNTLLIMDYPRWSRSSWYFRGIRNNSNCLLLDAREDNIKKITKAIGGYYGEE